MAADPHPHERVPLLPPASASREVPLAPPAPSSRRLPRKASFTEVEKCCLRALLLDSTSRTNSITTPLLHHSNRASNLDQLTGDLNVANHQQIEHYSSTSNSNRCKDSLDENILFQLPFSSDGGSLEQRNTKFRQQLWQAHQIGAHSAIMKRASSHLRGRSSSRLTLSGRSATASDAQITPGGGGGFSEAYQQQGSRIGMSFGGSTFGNYDSGCLSRGSLASSTTAMTARSDIEVNPPRHHDEESSWGEEDGGFVHYNTWEVLNDE